MLEGKAKLLEELHEFLKRQKDIEKRKEDSAASYNEELKDVKKGIRQALKEIEDLAV